MQLLERILGVVAPHNCLGCGREVNQLLCPACEMDVLPVPSRCYRCKALTKEYATCTACRRQTPLKTVLVLAQHGGVAKELVHHTKYERAQAGIREMAALMAPRLQYVGEECLLVHIPTATSRVRLRGYDHAERLARELQRLSGRPAARLLARSGQAHQVGATRTVRLKQLETAFRPVNTARIRGARIVLVDDVLTTGATLETAARVLKRAGARSVAAIVFAQA